MTKAHGKYVVGGTRGNLASAYSFIRESLPSARSINLDDRSEPLVETELPLRIQSNASNALPLFDLPPASRRFQSELRVFPNPSSGQINVGGAIEAGATLRLFNPMGMLVMERQIGAEETTVQLDLNQPSAGLYTVEMIGSQGTTVKKVIMY
ncbi:MAG: T9SS type A sorting domain-containing protein [Saprospiraceae bacterium]|nr:T9SS type A sorting domain-containing protein [Saprospiraceae bacterium]